MQDFWLASGHHLLDRRTDGRLIVTDAFLKAYLARPEIAPVAESCAAERALHAELLRDPGADVNARLPALADADARHNYAVWLRFRDRLRAAPTLEDAYIALFRDGPGDTPPLFVAQMTQLIVRGLLDGVDDPFRARAGELFFRPQRVNVIENAVLLADEAVVTSNARAQRGDALAALGRNVDLDVMVDDNAGQYWARGDRHDFVLDLAFGRPGLDAFARLIEAWVRHLTGATVNVQPSAAISDKHWAWHVGLDAEATRIANALWQGEAVPQAELARVLCLFRLEFADPARMLARVAGRPVYLVMAMTAERTLRLKPQNLLVGLPLTEEAAA